MEEEFIKQLQADIESGLAHAMLPYDNINKGWRLGYLRGLQRAELIWKRANKPYFNWSA